MQGNTRSNCGNCSLCLWVEFFCRRLSAVTAGVTSPRHFIRLNMEHRDDLQVWRAFLDKFNRRSIWMEGPVRNYDLELFTDAAGPNGYGAFLGGRSEERWPKEWQDTSRIWCCWNFFQCWLSLRSGGKSYATKRYGCIVTIWG